MSELHRHVEDYLRLRRALGFKLRLHGDLLPHFADYLEAAGAATITTELAVSFAQLPQGVQPILWAHRLTMVRGFARYLKTIDPATEVPPLDVFGARYQRPTPYLWQEAEVLRLMEAAGRLQPALRARTCKTLSGLPWTTGMRIGEAIGLERAGVDLAAGVLTIKEAKGGRSRLVPLGQSTTDALASYVPARARLCPEPQVAGLLGLRRRHHPAPPGRGLGLRPDRHRDWPENRDEEATCARSEARPLRFGCTCRGTAVASTPQGRRGCRRRISATPTPPAPTGTCRPPPGSSSSSPPAWRAALEAVEAMSALAPALKALLADRLMIQQGASPDTIASYRGTFRLLLRLAAGQTAKRPSDPDFSDPDALTRLTR